MPISDQPTMRDTTQLAQPVAPPSSLPSSYPQPPAKLVRDYPEYAAFHTQMERIYKTLRETMRNANDDLVTTASQQATSAKNWYRDASGRLRSDGDVVIGQTISALAFEGGTVSGSNATFSGALNVGQDATFLADAWFTGKVRKAGTVDGWTVILDSGDHEIAIRWDVATTKIHFRINGTDVGGVLPS